jgi:amino acid permease
MQTIAQNEFMDLAKPGNDTLILPGIALGGVGLITIMAYNDLSQEVFMKYFHNDSISTRVVYCVVLTILMIFIIWIFKKEYGATTIDQDVMKYI